MGKIPQNFSFLAEQTDRDKKEAYLCGNNYTVWKETAHCGAFLEYAKQCTKSPWPCPAATRLQFPLQWGRKAVSRWHVTLSPWLFPSLWHDMLLPCVTVPVSVNTCTCSEVVCFLLFVTSYFTSSWNVNTASVLGILQVPMKVPSLFTATLWEVYISAFLSLFSEVVYKG